MFLTLSPDQRTADLEVYSWFFMSEYPQVVRLLTVVLHERAVRRISPGGLRAALPALGKVSRYESPEAWVVRVALNRAFSWRRREGRRRHLERVADGGEEPVGEPAVGRVDVLR